MVPGTNNLLQTRPLNYSGCIEKNSSQQNHSDEAANQLQIDRLERRILKELEQVKRSSMHHERQPDKVLDYLDQPVTLILKTDIPYGLGFVQDVRCMLANEKTRINLDTSHSVFEWRKSYTSSTGSLRGNILPVCFLASNVHTCVSSTYLDFRT